MKEMVKQRNVKVLLYFTNTLGCGDLCEFIEEKEIYALNSWRDTTKNLFKVYQKNKILISNN